MWKPFQKLYRDSVVQLIVDGYDYSLTQPYKDPKDFRADGTGFFVTKELILTNAHVVNNIHNVICRISKFGKRDIKVQLIGICNDKDIGLLRIMEDVGDITPLPLGDNLQLKETDEVMTIGYPLGQEQIKFTTGIISGFYPNIEKQIDDVEDTPTYLQITASLNPGTSGGPLINSDGKVVGINSSGYPELQNISYAIGIRTVMGILNSLTKNPILHVPKFGIDWCNTKDNGIHVSFVKPNSCFDMLKHGDIITNIRIILTDNQIINGKLDNYGDMNLFDRKFTLKEVLDIIPVESEIELSIIRNKQSFNVKAKYVIRGIQPLQYRSLYFEPLKYLIVGGMCIVELTLNHIKTFEEFKEYDSMKKLYKRYLMISYIFPGSEASIIRSIDELDILKSVNGIKVKTIEKLKEIVENVSRLEFMNKDGDILIL